MLANLLTFFRIALIPIIMMGFYIPSRPSAWISSIAFMLACLTDFLDGYIARSWQQVTKLGQFLDPVADKMLVASTLLFLAGFGKVHPLSFIPATIILCREVLVSGLRDHLGGDGQQLSVTSCAKWKTALQMLSIGLLLLGRTPRLGYLPAILGEGLLWVSALITLWTGGAYLYKSRQALGV